MHRSHARPVVSTVFDEPNLVSSAGLVPLMGLARHAGLRELADEHLTEPTDKGANAGVNAGLKLSSVVAGMAAGADSIDDLALLRHGAMGKVFDRPCAPSTLGSFLRTFTFGCRPRPPARRGGLAVAGEPGRTDPGARGG